MSVSDSYADYAAAYAARSRLLWAADPASAEARIRAWAPNALVVAASAEHGEKLAGLLDVVVERDSLLPWRYGGPPSESLAGYYQGVPVTVLHLGITPGATGPSYVDMALERLRGGPTRRVVVIGEASSLQPAARIGDLVVPMSAIRADDSHRSYAAPDVPAVADWAVKRALRAAAEASGRRTHSGVCWSCGAGAGLYDPALAGEAWRLHQLGVVAQTLEAATAYLMAGVLGLQMGSAWLVADSVFEPLTWLRPTPRLSWEAGWAVLVRLGLEALRALHKEQTP